MSIVHEKEYTIAVATADVLYPLMLERGGVVINRVKGVYEYKIFRSLKSVRKIFNTYGKSGKEFNCVAVYADDVAIAKDKLSDQAYLDALFRKVEFIGV